MNTKLSDELREQLLVALTNQWASMAEEMDEGDFPRRLLCDSTNTVGCKPDQRIRLQHRRRAQSLHQ